MSSRNRVVRALFICTALLLPGCGSGEDAGGTGGRIVFYSSRDGNPEIYVMNADGSNPVRITSHPSRDLDPDLSPDGRQIVFTSDRDGNDDIFVVDARGGEPANLTNNPATDAWARWSPDGTVIAFHSNRDGNPEIYIMNADGSGVRRVTNYSGDDLWPEWSPDGSRLTFRRDRDVYVMKVDGSNAIRVTDHPMLDQMASWSPDGRRLAFMSMREGYCSVFTANADGSDLRHLTPKPQGDDPQQWCSRAPAWTPDGRVLFMSMRPETGSDAQIYVVNADGSGLRQLTATPGVNGAPRSR